MNTKNHKTALNLESQRRKAKIYAVFQFTSFVGYFMMISAFIFVIISDDFFLKTFENRYDDSSSVSNVFKLLFTFGIVTPSGIFYSLLVYAGLMMIPLSWIAGIYISNEEERTLTDSLFVLFVIIPVLSSVFALIAQISNSEILVNKDEINKKAEYTNQLKIARKEKRDQLDVLEQELQILTKEHNIAIHKIYKRKKGKNWGIPIKHSKGKTKVELKKETDQNIIVNTKPTLVNPFIRYTPLEVLNQEMVDEITEIKTPSELTTPPVEEEKK